MSQFDTDALAKRIREAREAAGLSRETLAEKMFISISAIAKWEQGKNTPRLPELMSLAEILNVDIHYFLEKQKEKKMVLDELSIINSDAAKTITYSGVEEIIPAWNVYWKDYDNAVNSAYLSNRECTWDQDNSFRILINRETRQLIAIRDFGMYQPSTSKILFRTSYLPLFTHQPETAEVLTARANETLNMFETELDNMLSKFNKPLFLIEYLGTNNYLAWSLTEHKYLFVYDYKLYRSTFRVSQVTIKSPDEIQGNTGYGILPPSKTLIDCVSYFDTNLSPEIWSRKMSWDPWEPRSEKQPILLHSDRHSDLYSVAVDLINLGRRVDCGCDTHFADLENRVERLERLDSLGAPNEILDKEAELIRTSMTSINTILK